jgi:hypothetical protein
MSQGGKAMEREKRDQTLESLRDELEQTRALYESAKDECERVRKAQAGLDRGAEAVQRAALLCEFLQQTYRCALQRYNERLLRNFSFQRPETRP